MSLKIFNEVGKHVPGDCSLREQQIQIVVLIGTHFLMTLTIHLFLVDQ